MIILEIENLPSLEWEQTDFENDLNIQMFFTAFHKSNLKCFSLDIQVESSL